MKTLYLECKMGAAGDMLMGALLELLQETERDEFLSRINSLGLPGVTVRRESATRCGITGTHIRVTVGGVEECEHPRDHEHDEHPHDHVRDDNAHEHNHDEHPHNHEHDEHPHDQHDEHPHDHEHDEHPHDHEHDEHPHDHEHDEHPHTHEQDEHPHDHEHDEHPHDHEQDEHPHDHEQDEHSHNHEQDEHPHNHGHFSYADILSLIDALPLSDSVKSNALTVYRLIGDAESAVHGVPIEQIHFHEVGSLDAVADVVGCCMLLELLGADKIIASPVCTGSGTVRCAHGILPVPAPATARLLLGIPCYSGDVESELCTPTGAALLRHFAARFGDMPKMTIEKLGYGMGTKDFSSANCVRAFFGEASENADPQGGAADEIYELCCNLDDMSPEAVGCACGILLREGALDVFTSPIYMKKFRPATLLCCLCRPADKNKFVRLMLRHTTTLGVRSRLCERNVLRSTYVTAETGYGKIRVKCSEGYGVQKCKAEYDDVKAAADRFDVPFETVVRSVDGLVNPQRVHRAKLRGYNRGVNPE